MRKIIHIDMDAFYASVELRERPDLRHLPVVISSHHPRAVIAAASYPAREFGLRSAMSMSQARKLCPQVVIIEPNFENIVPSRLKFIVSFNNTPLLLSLYL